MPSDLNALENELGYRFDRRPLIERAITHRSWAHEQVSPGAEHSVRQLHNESLEWVGDAVLGLVITDHLFRSFPDLGEGKLSVMRRSLINEPTLTAAARRVRLGDFLRFGVGEEKTGGRRKPALLADALEAVIGAIYLDGGIAAARAFILRALGEELEIVSPELAAAADFKTLLQERVQARFHSSPLYRLIETEGPPHRRTFFVEVSFDGNHVRGSGQSIKAAETEAARLALELMSAETAIKPGEGNPTPKTAPAE